MDERPSPTILRTLRILGIAAGIIIATGILCAILATLREYGVCGEDSAAPENFPACARAWLGHLLTALTIVAALLAGAWAWRSSQDQIQGNWRASQAQIEGNRRSSQAQIQVIRDEKSRDDLVKSLDNLHELFRRIKFTQVIILENDRLITAAALNTNLSDEEYIVSIMGAITGIAQEFYKLWAAPVGFDPRVRLIVNPVQEQMWTDIQNFINVCMLTRRSLAKCLRTSRQLKMPPHPFTVVAALLIYQHKRAALDVKSGVHYNKCIEASGVIDSMIRNFVRENLTVENHSSTSYSNSPI